MCWGKGRYSSLRFVFLCSTWILHWKLSHAEIYCIGFALIFTWNTEGLFTIQGHLILDIKPQKTPMFTFKWLFVVKFDQGSNSEYKGKWKEQNCPNNRDYKFFLTYQNQKWSSHFVHCFLMKVCNQDLKNICIEWENKIGVRKRKLFHQITKYNWFLCNMYFKLKKSPSLCQLALCYSTKIL